MSISIRVRPTNGQFTASVVGEPALQAIRPSRDEAVEALKQEIQELTNRGELVTCEIEPQGLMALFGKYRDDPTLKEICRRAYAARDAEKRRLAKPSRARKSRKQGAK